MKGNALKNLDVLIIKKEDVGKDEIRMDFLQIKKAAMILRAVNHKLRQSILKLLEDFKKLTVTEIYVKLRLEQSVASQHLAILRKAGIVKTIREGKYIYYSINSTRIEEINQFIERLLK